MKEKAKPVITRSFQKYTSEQRANRMASPRMSNTQKEKNGEYFYTNEREPNIAYSTAKEAKERWATFPQSAIRKAGR